MRGAWVRRRGASSRPTDLRPAPAQAPLLLLAAPVVAVLMALVAAYGFLLHALVTTSLQEAVGSLGFLWLLYSVELLVLLMLFGVAGARSRSRIVRLAQSPGVSQQVLPAGAAES